MEYKIIWSHFSENQIEIIFNYYKNQVNLKLAKKIIREIISSTDVLIRNSKIGTFEPSLKNRKIIYQFCFNINKYTSLH
ncbi:MAG: type II toxin-antitoxin system RelE/ParE family toxin [Sphingobacteriales bacterium]|nr:MAG: type II toxin-antitoxin system RelE/ParE family toxin [Sphingobacteriales bacterium]